MAKEPDRRYQTGDEFADDLRALADLLLQNAAPSFSRAPLPSERDVGPRVGPSGEDLYDDHLSELMQLMPEFEAAIAQGEAALARQIFVRLEAVGTANSHFSEPLRLCRTRLAEMEIAGAPAGQAYQQQPAQDQGTNTKTCERCGAANRSAAVYCIQCGARLLAGAPVTPDTAPTVVMPWAESRTGPDLLATARFQGSTPSPPVETRLPKPGEGGESAAVASASAVEAPQPTAPEPEWRVLLQERLHGWWQRFLGLARKQKQVVGLAAGLLAAIVAMIAIVQLFPPIPVKPAVAFALVKPAHASLYTEPNAKSKSITVAHGEEINVIEMPQRRDQQWLPVQLVREKGKKVFRPGYMHAVELEKWYSPSATSQLRLTLLSQAGEAGSDEQVQQVLYDLQHLVERVPEAQESREAQVYMAKLELILARNLKAAGRPDADWRSHVASAQKDLTAGGGEAEPSVVEDYQKQIAALTVAEASATPTPPPPNPPDADAVRKKRIAKFLKDAEDVFMSNIKKAENDVDKVLEMDPGNPAAQALQERIRRRKVALEEIGQ
jgi:ribosomal protein L40E